MSTKRRNAASGAIALALAAALSAGASTATAADEDRSVLRAVGAVGTTVTGAGQVATTGETDVELEVAALEGGRISVVDGPGPSSPTAWRFPAFSPLGGYPRAVLAVTPTSGEALDPGSSDFSYGAVLRLDQASTGRLLDDGDNVYQRGRYTDQSMFKMQVDDGRPSCLVSGSAGRVLVRSSVEIAPHRWYRVVCSRVGSTVGVLVRQYGDVDSTVNDYATGATGSVSMPEDRAASIGGKLTATGLRIADDSDQFNGAIAKVWSTRG